MANNKKTSLYIAEFLNFVSACEKEFTVNEEKQKIQEKLTQDYLHKLELDHLDRNERSKLATALRDNRRERRKAKDVVEQTAAIVAFFSEPANTKFLNRLREVLGQVRKVERYQNYRTYLPKILTEDKE